MSNSPSIAQEAPAPLHLLRVTRLEDRVLEECELGAADLQQLADQNVGLFAGGYRTIEMMERQLIQLAKSQAACRWVVCLATIGSPGGRQLEFPIRRNASPDYSLTSRTCHSGLDL
ncbi:MAG: hypothetical protein WD049_03840, partial [Candidatus Paceibacterota bacterium]